MDLRHKIKVTTLISKKSNYIKKIRMLVIFFNYSYERSFLKKTKSKQ